MSADHKALVTRWFEEVWNKGRVEAIDEMFPATAVARGLGPDLHGPVAFKSFHAGFRDAFPDLKVHVDEVLAEGDRAAYRLTATGTHMGHGLGIPPTGRAATLSAMGFVRIENGQIAEAWNMIDQLGMLMQLGVMNPLAQ